MRISNCALIVLGILGFSACKKEENHMRSALQELHYSMYDSVYTAYVMHSDGSYGLYPFHVPLHYVDTMWRDTTAATPYIIYHSDTLRQEAIGMYVMHHPILYYYSYSLLFSGDSVTYRAFQEFPGVSNTAYTNYGVLAR